MVVTNYDDPRMSAHRRRIEDLLVRIENEFLADPDLKLTVSEASRRFSADDVTCEAVLDALVELFDVGKTADRVYGRLSRHLMAA